VTDQAKTYHLTTTVDLDSGWQRGNLPDLLRQLADEIEQEAPATTLRLRLDRTQVAEFTHAERWRVRRRVRRSCQAPDPDPAHEAVSAQRLRQQRIAAGVCPECGGDGWAGYAARCDACKGSGRYPAPDDGDLPNPEPGPDDMPF
jgi:hypothetical protein